MRYNTKTQYYHGIPLTLIVRKSYGYMNAKRFTLYGTNQNIWIPNCYLLEDGTIKNGVNLNWIFNKESTKHKIGLAKDKLRKKEIMK